MKNAQESAANGDMPAKAVSAGGGKSVERFDCTNGGGGSVVSTEKNTSRLIYRHVAGLEQKIALLESQNSALVDRVAALVEALLELQREIHGGPAQPWEKADAALRAAGVATEGGLEDTL